MIADGFAFEYTCDLPYRYQAEPPRVTLVPESRAVVAGRLSAMRRGVKVALREERTQ